MNRLLKYVLSLSVPLSVALTLSATGCQSEPDSATTEAAAGANGASHDHGDGGHGEAAHGDADHGGHDHGGHDHGDAANGGHDHGDAAKGGHDHGGWWCQEHGVPEGECPRCDTSLLAEFKAKGDWCDEHGRPESQCFVCAPERFEKFAARYEARFGESPPQPTE